MTVAGSPGASRIRKKFSTTIASRTITPFTIRWATNDSIRRPSLTHHHDFTSQPSARSLVNPGVPEAVIDADRGRDQVLDLAIGDSGKLQFQHPRHRHVLDQYLLSLL